MQSKEATELVKGTPRDESFTQLLSELATNSAALVRDELALAKREVSEKLSSLSKSVVLIAAGALVGLIALMALCAAAIISLVPYLGAWQSALAVGLALAVVGGLLAYPGVRGLKTINLKPEQTIESLEEDKRWLKEIT
jgi:hypothetical protein